MIPKKAIQMLSLEFPEKTIVRLPKEKPTEVICEIEPTKEHPDYSVAIAIIEKSEPHFHRKSTEKYEVLQGTIELFIDGKRKILKKSESVTIQPNQVHWAKGKPAKIKVTSNPGWTKEDHILAQG